MALASRSSDMASRGFKSWPWVSMKAVVAVAVAVVFGCAQRASCSQDDLVPGETDNVTTTTAPQSNETVIRDNTYADPDPDNIALKVGIHHPCPCIAHAECASRLLVMSYFWCALIASVMLS
jgi:hypothetical protein